TAILSGSGGFQGVGFAVPINLARYVMDAIIKEGKVARGFLGVHLQQELTPTLGRKFDLPNTSGALIALVDRGSPADKAGLKDGDFITEVNGKKVADQRQLRLMVAQMAPGSKVNLSDKSKGEQILLRVWSPRVGGMQYLPVDNIKHK